MIFINLNDKHYDIYFLERRLRHLISIEEYEKAVIVRKWIDELALLHHGLNSEELMSYITTI